MASVLITPSLATTTTALPFSSTVLTNTFCTTFFSPPTPSTKKMRLLPADSRNWPGVTFCRSSRFSKRATYSSLFFCAHGVAYRLRTPVTSTSGRPKLSTGLIQRDRLRPEANHTTISESL